MGWVHHIDITVDTPVWPSK